MSEEERGEGEVSVCASGVGGGRLRENYPVVLPAAVEEDEEEGLHGPSRPGHFLEGSLEDDLLVVEVPEAVDPGPHEHPVKVSPMVEEHDGALAVVRDLVSCEDHLDSVDDL